MEAIRFDQKDAAVLLLLPEVKNSKNGTSGGQRGLSYLNSSSIDMFIQHTYILALVLINARSYMIRASRFSDIL